MNLRERILEKVQPGGISAKDLYDRLRGEQLSAVDCAVAAMLRDSSLRRVGDRYYLPSDPVVFKSRLDAAAGAESRTRPSGPRSAWPVDMMDRRRGDGAHSAPQSPGPTKFAASPAMVAAEKRAAAAQSAAPAAPKTQRCRGECGKELPIDCFQMLHGKRHHTCRICHGKKAAAARAMKSHRAPPSVPPSVSPQDLGRGAPPKVRTDSVATPLGAEPVRPGPLVSPLLIEMLCEERDAARRQIKNLTEAIAEMGDQIARAESRVKGLTHILLVLKGAPHDDV